MRPKPTRDHLYHIHFDHAERNYTLRVFLDSGLLIYRRAGFPTYGAAKEKAYEKTNGITR